MLMYGSDLGLFAMSLLNIEMSVRHYNKVYYT